MEHLESFRLKSILIWYTSRSKDSLRALEMIKFYSADLILSIATASE